MLRATRYGKANFQQARGNREVETAVWANGRFLSAAIINLRAEEKS